MPLTFTMLTPDDTAGIDAACGIMTAAAAVDAPDTPPPSRGRLVELLTHPLPGQERVEHILAYRDGVAVGLLVLVMPTLANTDVCQVRITVPPELRRRGVGRALYHHAVTRTISDGRRRIAGSTVDRLSAAAGSAGFAEALGAQPGLKVVNSRLSLDTVNEAALDAGLADAWPLAQGYSLVRWRDAVPERYLADLALLEARLIEEAPVGDLDWKASEPDPQRIRDIEAGLRRRNKAPFNVAMRHDATDRLVAWTALIGGGTYTWYFQQGITLVLPEHRGRRLGLISKIENLRYAREHAPLRVVDTGNADVNEHMLAINTQLGFRPHAVEVIWQINLDDEPAA